MMLVIYQVSANFIVAYKHNIRRQINFGCKKV